MLFTPRSHHAASPSRRARLQAAAIGALVVGSLGASLAPAFATVYSTLGNDVSVGTVKLWDHYLGYVPERASVVACDLATGQSAVLAAQEAGSDAVFDYVVGSGPTAAYAVLSARPQVGSSTPVDWSLHTVDLRTGKRQVVAEAPVRFDELPRPAIAGPWLVWADASAAGRAVVTFDIRSGRRRTVAPPAVKAGNVGITGDGVVAFDGESGPGARDVWLVPADGSAAPRRVTDQGAVQPLVVANGRLAWRNAPPGRADERWTMVPGRDETPVRVATRGRVVPGADFLVAEEPMDGDFPRLALHSVAGGGPWPLTSEAERLDLGALFDVAGDVVGWVTLDYPPGATLRRHLRLARVVR